MEEGSCIKHVTSFRTMTTLVELNMSHSAPWHVYQSFVFYINCCFYDESALLKEHNT